MGTELICNLQPATFNLKFRFHPFGREISCSNFTDVIGELSKVFLTRLCIEYVICSMNVVLAK